MHINWKVRFANKDFWMTFIPALLLLITVVADVFGIHLDLGDLGNKLREVVKAVFLLLAILGIVNDPTTAGTLCDSEQAMTYQKPKE